MVLDIGPGIQLESNGARENVKHRTTRLALRRSSSMVSRHGMVWQRPGMNCSPAAEIHVKRADGESPHPLLTTGPLMQELHGSRGETFMLDLSTSLKASSPPLSAKKSPSSSTWIGCRLRIHTVRERSMAGCPYSYNGLQKRLKSPLLVQCQAANSLRLAAGFNPGRQHTDMDSILHIHPQFRRSIPGIRAHDKSVLDREHALRISAQTSSSLLEGTSTSAQRWCTYRVCKRFSEPESCWIYWTFCAASSFNSMRKVPHGTPPKRCATQDGWMGGIKSKDMQVADCVAIPILVAGLSYKGKPVLNGRASSVWRGRGRERETGETGLASILAHRCISGTRNAPVSKRDHERKDSKTKTPEERMHRAIMAFQLHLHLQSDPTEQQPGAPTSIYEYVLALAPARPTVEAPDQGSFRALNQPVQLSPITRGRCDWIARQQARGPALAEF
ncbi:hypothetical protein CI102_10516 [Trichoderma harzianum]|nr:hypothetical protein CI102_10516 [Trichoderma harzianum]